MTEAEMDIVAKHYIIAALWADAPEGTNPRATEQATKRAKEIVRLFVSYNEMLIRQVLDSPGWGDNCAQDFGGERCSEWPFAALGHDLYLSSHGHGVGFRDRGLGDLGRAISKVCDPIADRERNRLWYAEPEFYRGWLYLH